MSTTIACPFCGHPHQAHRLQPGILNFCERCEQPFTPGDSRVGFGQSLSDNPFARPPLVPTAGSFAPATKTEPFGGGQFGPQVDEPHGSSFLAIFLVLGLGVAVCAVVGGYVLIKAREKVVVAAKKTELENLRRQQELQRKGNSRPRVSKPKLPASKPPPPSPIVRPPVMPPPGPPRLDDLLAALEDPMTSRPKWSALRDLERLPVDPERRSDVSVAIEPFINSADQTTAHAAIKAAQVWGTEWNVASLTALLDSPHALCRWDAIRALAKISPTEETADLIAAKIGDFSNLAAIRDALKELGSSGEAALLNQFESGDRLTKQAALNLLGEIGTAESQERLQKLIDAETDIGLKNSAQFALQRMKSRKP